MLAFEVMVRPMADSLLTRRTVAARAGRECCLGANQYWIPYQTVKINDCLRTGLAPES